MIRDEAKGKLVDFAGESVRGSGAPRVAGFDGEVCHGNNDTIAGAARDLPDIPCSP
jgi:hypothetical protein